MSLNALRAVDNSISRVFISCASTAIINGAFLWRAVVRVCSRLQVQVLGRPREQVSELRPVARDPTRDTSQ